MKIKLHNSLFVDHSRFKRKHKFYSAYHKYRLNGTIIYFCRNGEEAYFLKEYWGFKFFYLDKTESLAYSLSLDKPFSIDYVNPILKIDKNWNITNIPLIP